MSQTSPTGKEEPIDFSTYGVKGGPQEFVEEFVSQMMLYGMTVTEINFAPGGLSKFEESIRALKSQGDTAPKPPALALSINVPCGPVRFGETK